MITRRSTLIIAALLSGGLHPLAAQRRQDSLAAFRRELTSSWRRGVPHYGKWVTAAGSVALIVFAQREHNRSNRDWDALLDICRSAQDACARGPDGRYVRSDAEQLYQRSRGFDRRANRWLLGAQAGLLATTALFIIDLHPGAGPENIPYPSSRFAVGLRLPW